MHTIIMGRMWRRYHDTVHSSPLQWSNKKTYTIHLSSRFLNEGVIYNQDTTTAIGETLLETKSIYSSNIPPVGGGKTV